MSLPFSVKFKDIEYAVSATSGLPAQAAANHAQHTRRFGAAVLLAAPYIQNFSATRVVTRTAIVIF